MATEAVSAAVALTVAATVATVAVAAATTTAPEGIFLHYTHFRRHRGKIFL